MSETKINLAGDLRDAAEMTELLAEYLRGEQVYGSLGGGMFGSGHKPALTVGALLLRLRRLRALRDRLTADQQQLLDKTDAQHAAVRHDWRIHYDEKLMREGISRLDAMRAFFEECLQNPGNCANNYLPEALRRTIVEEIAVAMDELGVVSQAFDRKLRETDSKLRRFVRPSGFIWAEELAEVYPAATFWWLYSRPSSTPDPKD